MFIQAIFEAIAALFGTITKLTPSDHIRDGRFDLNKERLTGVQRIKIQNHEYSRLKGHPKVDIASEINFSYANLDIHDRELLIKNVTDRVWEYRYRHPVIFKKWIKEQDGKTV